MKKWMRSRDTITHQQGNFLSTISSSTVTIHSHERDAANDGPHGGGQGTRKEAHGGRTRYARYFYFLSFISLTSTRPPAAPTCSPLRKTRRPATPAAHN